MDRADEDHRSCAELLADFTEQLVVPAPVVVELDWLSLGRLGPEPFAEFLADVDNGSIVIADLVRADYVRVRELLRDYRDLNVGFVDAAVMAITERLREPKLATLDHRHFRTIRPRHVDTLELLPA